ncbi:DUF551 domain-containing protein [Klebsiella quasipneumoniae]|uniref:DUF551 domain-containing protein n=1 Tax=Klebsiella quasipneumoniae TaxID=1463165 RepID=UPI001EDD5723|nr:DUF551 domain-containing protein [Klebsiella quasipneumoniae]
MTKSTITREQLLEIIETDHVQCGEASYLARMALAAMDSEPVEMPLDYLQGHKDGLEWAAQLAEANHPETGDWLYDDPIELAKAIRKGPDMPPVQPVADSEPVAWTWQHLKQWHVTNDEERARDLAWDGVKVEPLYRRAAMLQAGNHTEQLLDMADHSGDATKKAGNSPVIPDGSAGMLRRWLAFGRGMQNAGSQLPHNLIAETESMLAAAPHDTPALNSVQSVDSVADRWIPVSEQKPDCWCLTCRPVTLNDMRFVVCPDCGNKRCPRANDHRNACTRSNEPGQEGSAYPDTPREVK